MATPITGSATAQVSTGPLTLYGVTLSGAGDAATIELREGTDDSSPLIDTLQAGAGESVRLPVPDVHGVPLAALRVVRVAGTAPSWTCYIA